MKRSSGLLLHPTSLPGPFAVGGCGPAALEWIDRLAAMGQTWWQILPLGPTGPTHSPYQSYSAFAGNLLLLSPEWLEEERLASRSDFPAIGADPQCCQFRAFRQALELALPSAWRQFQQRHSAIKLHDFEQYCAAQADWLEDYARFTCIHRAVGHRPLAEWPDDLRRRDPARLREINQRFADQIAVEKFGQFLFDRHWRRIVQYARAKHVFILGDVPIFVARDSADVWSHPELFLLDPSGRPTVQAGVPPDYFSQDGQLWGNPIYDWKAMESTGFNWWIRRLKRNLELADWLRLDHFRGFVQAWHVPSQEQRARQGTWVPGPGRKLFDALKSALGGLPLVAEDLGIITPDVTELRTALGLPGMVVLQFMLGKPDNIHQPHNHQHHSVCYTGTHDNNTSCGWYESLSTQDQRFVQNYLGRSVTNAAHDMIRLAWASVAHLAIAPVQDLLSLGSEARMNTPGVADGNWTWRLTDRQIQDPHIRWLHDLTQLFGRINPGTIIG